MHTMHFDHHATHTFVSVLARPLVIGALAAVAAGAAAASLAPGASVTYRDATGREWCATVRTLGVGADTSSWAWVSIDADPRRVVHAEVAELVAGCKLPMQASRN
jgi:hypothetical protein